jgi:chemotaxis protein MotB
MLDPMLSSDSQSDLFEDHEEELWIVSYADMVTLLFGFFVILYSFSNLDDKKFDEMTKDMARSFRADVKKEDLIAEESGTDQQLKAFKLLVTMLNIADSPEEAAKKIEQISQSEKTIEAAQELLEETAKKDNLSIKQLVSGSSGMEVLTEIILPELSLFSAGRADLIPGSEKKLHALAMDLRSVTDVREIEVVGHTDSSPVSKQSPYRDNFTLSSMRAGAVAQQLIKYGVPETMLSVKGMGGLRPIVPDKDPSGKYIAANMAKNRRVHIVLKRRLDSHGR